MAMQGSQKPETHLASWRSMCCALQLSFQFKHNRNLPCLRRTQVCLCNAHCLLDSSVTRQHQKSDQLSVTREMESSRCPSAGASNPDWRIWNPILITIFQVLLSSAPDRLLPCQGFRAQAFRFQPNAWNLEGLNSSCPLPLLLNLETSRVFPNFIASSTCGVSIRGGNGTAG
ncbi:hypothetical protein BJX68DRAFT_76966 [Aspergillus pseudodeflectus]|uniref:Uncharacterized protein n=1 Tax=Aspergillus pseudodeflectus TaxID=176178 RepID=A0ABR4KIE7_9EURO